MARMKRLNMGIGIMHAHNVLDACGVPPVEDPSTQTLRERIAHANGHEWERPSYDVLLVEWLTSISPTPISMYALQEWRDKGRREVAPLPEDAKQSPMFATPKKAKKAKRNSTAATQVEALPAWAVGDSSTGTEDVPPWEDLPKATPAKPALPVTPPPAKTPAPVEPPKAGPPIQAPKKRAGDSTPVPFLDFTPKRMTDEQADKLNNELFG